MEVAVTNTPVNWLLLGELVVVVIVAAAFLFYLNRLFGAVVAFFIRLYTWRKHQAYITIGSLQISPLAGRIAFRAVEYHSSNISFRALHGHVTFRYWWGRVRQEGDSQSTNTRRAKLPCRLVIYAEGVECFVYNRTPAYDAIVERMKKHERAEKLAKSSSSSRSSEENPVKLRLRKAFKGGREGLTQLDSNDSSDGPVEKPHTLPDTIHPVETPQFDSVDWFRELLPVELTVVQGSVILGSDATPMILIGDFKRANGLIEITDSRSICDKYKMIVNLNFQTVNVLYRTNVDWSGPLLAHGKKVYDELIRRDPDLVKRPPSDLSTKAAFRALSRIYEFIADPIYSKPPRAGMPRDRTWRGLARYREEKMKEPIRTEREYGKIHTLLVTKAMDVTYYADTPGPVPRLEEIAIPDSNDELGNVDLAPEYGIDIAIHGGSASYGPWADRQREALQRAFAPSIFFDTEPKSRLRPGETRLHANLALSVQFIDALHLQLPTREPSKDWQFDAKPDAERSFGWMGVTIGPNSSIIYTQSQFATQRGYDAMLVIHLDSLAMNTSINGGCDFIKAKACRLSVTMPTPLRWNAQRDWGIDVTLEDPDIALLRDHVTLISDLAKDWSSGVEGDFHHFVPNHYNFRVAMNNYAFHLFINDSNIVDEPGSRELNAFVDVSGPSLSAYVAVASTQYRPEFSVIPFSVNLKDVKVKLSLPEWDTHLSFATEMPLEVGRIGSASASGSYRFYSRPHPDHQETLALHLEAHRVAFKCLGWALRRLFCVKDNYFGMFTQFTTSQEYLERFDHDPDAVGDPVREKYRPGRSDAFSVQVTLDVRDSLILLSDEIYSCDSGLALPVPQLQMSLKSVEAFMELSLDVPPTYVVSAPDIQAAFASCRAPPPSSVAALFIEGITVKANRLFGPQPEATTYLCLWEAIIPKVSAFLTPAFLSTVQQSVRAVVYNFGDVENAPTDIYIPATPPDVTFFKLSLDAASVLLEVGDAGVAVDIPRGVNLDSSSLATRFSASSVGVLVPEVSVNVLSRPSRRHKWSSIGFAASGVSVDTYSAPKHWEDKARAQQKFLRHEDESTQRIWYMYKDGEDTSNGHHLHSLYLPRPRVVVDDEDTDNDSSEGEASSASTTRRPKLINRRSRSRSFRTAKETFCGSSSDESDDVSSVASSTSSIDTDSDRDMADILADQYKHFKSFATPASRPGPGREPVKIPHKVQANGKVVRISAEPITLRGDVDTAVRLGSIAYALLQDTSRPLQVIDATLSSLVGQWKDRNDEAIPLTLDIAMPSLDASITTLTPSSGPVSRLDCVVSGLRTVVTQRTAEVAVTATLSSSHITLSSLSYTRPAVSLADIGQDFATPDSHPLIHLDQLGSDIAFDQRVSHRQIRVHANSTDLKMVSMALPLATQSIDIWKTALADLPTTDQGSRLTPLLVHAAHAAGLQIASAPQPTFASLTYHSLQVNDSRNIRLDHGWRILSRVRQILLAFPDIGSPPSDPDIVMNRLAALDWFSDAGNAVLIRQIPFIRNAFNLTPSTPDDTQTQSDSAFMSVENVVFRHYDQLLGTSRIGSSFVRIGTSSAGVYRTKQILEGDLEVQDRAVVAIGSIDAEVQDSIFAVYRHASSNSTTPPTSALSAKINHTLLLQAHLASADLAIFAGGLRLNTTLNDSTGTFGHRQRLHKRHDLPAYSTVRNDATLILANAGVTLWQPSDDENPSNKADREVLILSLNGANLLYDTQGSTKMTSVKERRIVVGLQSVQFDSRPTFRRALDFAQNWQEKHYAHYEPTITQIRAEMAKNPAKVPQPNRLPARFTFDILVERAGITIRTAKSAWIGWQLGRLYACEQGSIKNHTFGIRASPQSVGFYSSRNLAITKDTVKLDLPEVKVDGSLKTSWKQGHYDVKVQLGHFNCIVKPSALDRLLSLYKKLAPEIRQLVLDYGSYAKTLFSSEPAPVAEKGALFQLVLGVEGVSIGLRADDVATTLLLQAFALRGRATNQAAHGQALSWQAGVQHFEVSLGQIDDATLTCQRGASRKYKSAYMYLDVDVHETPSDTGAPSKIGIALSRIQTFMHIAALSEISDLVSSWISDVHILTDQRGEDVAEVKQQTSRFLKKIDTSDTQPEDSWFSTRLLKVDIASFGLAIPLGAQTAIDLREQSAETPALLLSVRSISFTNRRNETARFCLQHIRLQFVAEFDNSKPEHFAGEFHSSINRMTLPSIDSEAQMSSTPDAWTLAAHCTAIDFNLSLDPTVTDGIFQLIDLYERGCHHIDYLEKRYAAETAKVETIATKYDTPHSPVTARQRQRIHLRLSFVFESGKVQLYRAPQTSRSPLRSDEHDEVVLPGISVWIDHAGPAKGAGGEDTAGLVIVNTAIHRSRNVLKPSILPFFAQVASRIEKRLKKRADRKSSGSEPSAKAAPSGPSDLIPASTRPSVDIIRIRLTLRIDQSELRFACTNDSYAYVNLRWESGGFFASTSIGADETSTVAGTITGVTTNLSHEYDGRSCIEASARDLTFSIIHTPDWRDGQTGVSVVMDTKVSAQFRLDLFSAWLTFMAVWVDNAPSLDMPIIAAIEETTAAVPLAPSTERKHVGFAILARFQAIEFDADIAVTHAKLEITPVILHTLSNGLRTRVELEVGKTEITATGDVSGTVRSDSFRFQTSRKSTRAADDPDSQLLSLRMEAGDLRGSLFLGQLNIIRFHFEPATVDLTDDWQDPLAPPLLAFAVHAGRLSAVTRLLAIPQLLSRVYAILDAVATQHRIAASRSEAFRNRQIKKQNDPSPIAAALVQTMQKTATQRGLAFGSDVEVSQSMTFKLAGVDLGVFNDNTADGQSLDFYQFLILDVGANLIRKPGNEDGKDKPFRDLALSVGSIRWNIADGRAASAAETKDISAEDMIKKGIKSKQQQVAMLPSMNLRMDSDEYTYPSPRLLYHFVLVWGKTDSDIAIWPNFFDSAWRALKKLIDGIEHEEAARARRLGIIRPNKHSDTEKESDKAGKKKGKEKGKARPTVEEISNSLFSEGALKFEPRNPAIEIEPPIPNLKVLGSGTKDATRLIPTFQQGVRDLPRLSHRFVTTSLEEGMDMLLKLYAKQLPERRLR